MGNYKVWKDNEGVIKDKIMIISKKTPLQIYICLRKGNEIKRLSTECYIPRLRKFLEEVKRLKEQGFKVGKVYIILMYKIDVV